MFKSILLHYIAALLSCRHRRTGEAVYNDIKLLLNTYISISRTITSIMETLILNFNNISLKYLIIGTLPKSIWRVEKTILCQHTKIN